MNANHLKQQLEKNKSELLSMHWIKVQLQQIKKEVQQLVIEMIENLMKFLDCWACMGVSLINDSSNFKYSCNIPKFNPSFSNGKGGKQYLMDILWELRSTLLTES